MAAFASDRRSGWVRVLVLILCALFIFATIATPPAYAVGETVALFGLAAVLSAATAALGFKLSNNAEGQATLEKMVQDFTGASIAAGLVLIGTKVNGLINGMKYIKMAVHNGKTYLDERIFAWCQQWLAQNGVYDSGDISIDVPSDYVVGHSYDVSLVSGISISQLCAYYGIDMGSGSGIDTVSSYIIPANTIVFIEASHSTKHFVQLRIWEYNSLNLSSLIYSSNLSNTYSSYGFNFPSDYVNYLYGYSGGFSGQYKVAPVAPSPYQVNTRAFDTFSNVGTLVSGSNDTGLSGTDTLGKDVIDLTLDQILDRLKEWAQDWYDAGADSVTNSLAGAKDLPLSVATGAATLNPDVAEDGPLVYFPTFGWSLPQLRSGETDTKTVDQGKENASAAETSTVDVAENQTVVNSLVSWALNYIDPDTGLFSKFPLCVPYDAYLLVTSSLGVDAVGSDSIFGASPGDLDGVVTESIDTYSDFQPIININNDFELDGKTYPISISIDLTPWQPLVTFFREGMALLLVAELIGSEYKRIRGH